MAVLVAVYLYDHVDEQIRRRVEERLAARYPRLSVSVRSAERVEGQGILIRDVVLAEPGARSPAAKIIHIGEMFLVCRADLEELIGGEPTVSQVVFRRPTFRATRRADGSWNTARLLPLPQFSDHPPPLIVEEGTIEIVDATSGDERPLTLRRVNLAMSPPGAARRARAGRGVSQNPRRVQRRRLWAVAPRRRPRPQAGQVESRRIGRGARSIAAVAPVAAALVRYEAAHAAVNSRSGDARLPPLRRRRIVAMPLRAGRTVLSRRNQRSPARPCGNRHPRDLSREQPGIRRPIG